MAGQVISAVPFDIILLALAFVVGGNVIYQQRQKAALAQEEAARLREVLDTRPDPNAVTRAFLVLADRGNAVKFGAKVPYESGYIERGQAAVMGWLTDCEALILAEAPNRMPDFRKAAQLEPRRGLGGMGFIRVEGDPKFYDIETPDQYSRMVERVRLLLVDIVQGR